MAKAPATRTMMAAPKGPNGQPLHKFELHPPGSAAVVIQAETVEDAIRTFNHRPGNLGKALTFRALQPVDLGVMGPTEVAAPVEYEDNDLTAAMEGMTPAQRQAAIKAADAEVSRAKVEERQPVA